MMTSKIILLLSIAVLVNLNEAIDSCFSDVNFYPCYCNNVSVEGHSISSVICERPLHEATGRILIPKMKYLVIDHLIIADAYWEGNPSNVNGPSTCDKYGNCRSLSGKTFISLIMPELSHFRIRELIVRNGQLNSFFLSNQTYFEEQKNYLRGLTLSHCSLFGVLRGLYPVTNTRSHHISTIAFKPLVKLEFLDLSSNNITAVLATAFQSSQLPALKELRLNRNLIKSIEKGSFQNLTSLEVLDLSSNKLKEVKTDIFPKNSSLITLNLGYNEIETLSSDILDELAQLLYLDLQFNFLFQIPSDLLKSSFEQLSRINLEGNFLLCGCDMKPEPSLALRKTPLQLEGTCQEPSEFAGLPIADISSYNCEHLVTNNAFKKNPSRRQMRGQ